MDADARYHRNTLIILAGTCLAFGGLGLAAVRLGLPALRSLAEITVDFWSWRLMGPFALYTMAAGLAGWFCSFLAEQRGVLSPWTCALMPPAIVLVAAGLCAASGSVPPFGWGLSLVCLVTMWISGMVRCKMGELV